MSALTPRQWSSPISQRYVERRATAELDALVACVWLLEVASDGPAYEHRTIPNGCVEITTVLGTGVLRIAGPKQVPTVGRVQPGHALVGLRFRPGAAPSVLEAPAAELIDVDVGVDALWGSAGQALGERLAEAPTPEHAMDLLERALAMRTSSALAPDPVVAEAVKRLQPWRRTAVIDVTAELFISPRQLRRRFVAAVGYGPKALQRILRFQGFLALGDPCTRADRSPPLARLAATAGYADQAHLTRECRQLTGLTPRAFLAEMRRSCGPSHDHAASFACVRRALLATYRPGSADGRRRGPFQELNQLGRRQ
jgi:AraC-like DNA-binding protein